MLTSLRLVNYRNYHDATFKLSNVTIVVGPNGIGKTNIIEALFLLATGRSFRTSDDRELIRFGQPYARVVGDSIDLTITAGERVKKQVRIDGKPHRLLHLLGVNTAVLFTPISLELVDGAPASRRQFMDILLSQTNPQYAYHLLEYQHIIKQRNQLLQQIRGGQVSQDTLSLWDDLMVQASIPVIETRKQMAETMGDTINRWYRALSPHKSDDLSVHYLSSVEKRRQVKAAELESLYYDRLRERRVAEIEAGRSLIGPHRDDFELFLNGHLIGHFGSRGQIRSAVVALKMFEFHYIREVSGKEPTLLFDDVFSEFDPYRRSAVLDITEHAQTILTATDIDHIGSVPKGADITDLEKQQKSV